eukprot:g4562.t1
MSSAAGLHDADVLCESKAAASASAVSETPAVSSSSGGGGGGGSAAGASEHSFHALAFRWLLKEDALAVLAPGLGLTYLFSKFVQLFCDKERSLVFVINGASEYDNVLSILEDEGAAKNLPKKLNSETNADRRVQFYDEGGCYFITNRVLVVDLLTKRLKPEHISGFLILNGHRATRTSILGLILRLYRQKNRTGFIKAFTDVPSGLLAGFGKVEKVLQSLLVPRMHLWPRFNAEVKSTIQGVKPELVFVEMQVTRTPLMLKIEAALIQSMKNCLDELCRSSHRLTKDEISVAEALSHAFDRRISRLLGSTGKAATRQLLKDIQTLRGLSQQLLRVDSVSFFSALRSVQKAATPRFGKRRQPMWLLADAADDLFKFAKRRVYFVSKQTGVSKRATLVLEANPKWRLLKEALEDIEKKDRADETTKGKKGRKVCSARRDVVLVFVRDDVTVSQLRVVLGPCGERALLRRQIFRYVRRNFPISQQQGPSGVGALLRDASRQLLSEDLNAWIVRARDADISSAFPNWEENVRFVWNASMEDNARALEALRKKYSNAVDSGGDAPTLRGFAFFSDLMEYCSINATSDATITGMSSGKEGEASTEASSDADTAAPDAAGDNGGDSGETRREMEMDTEDIWWHRASQSNPASGAADEAGDPSPSSNARGVETTNDTSNSRDSMYRSDEARVILMSYQGRTNIRQILLEMQPAHVVLYDPAVHLIRELEMYNALRSKARKGTLDEGLRVYFLMYADSTEEQRYLNSLKRETKCFNQLIEERARVVIPKSLLFPESQSSKRTTELETRFQTRVGGRSRNVSTQPRVIVDLREFRSGLPAILHEEGIELVPVTLDVGDYVLSPKVCVERKSIPDLYGSFKSGRLATQAEAMARHYELSALLIEFDPDRAFILEGAQELSSRIDSTSIISRMVLLARHFPTLRFLWSRSPHMTAKIYKMLKENREEPSAKKATSFKQNESSRTTTGGSSAVVNTGGGQSSAGASDMSARDFLVRLPGVGNVSKAKVLRRHVSSLAALSKMSVGDLAPLIGQGSAQKLHRFLHRHV